VFPFPEHASTKDALKVRDSKEWTPFFSMLQLVLVVVDVRACDKASRVASVL